jgi:hypothetical protein
MRLRTTLLLFVLLLSCTLILSCTSKKLTRAQAEELLKNKGALAASESRMLVYHACDTNDPKAKQVVRVLTTSGMLSSKPCPFELTPMGTMKGWKLQNVTGGSEFQAPCYVAAFERVSGIREEGPNKAVVNFDVSWNPPAGVTEVRNQAPGILYEGNCKGRLSTDTQFQAAFGLFDDGWRIETITPLSQN